MKLNKRLAQIEAEIAHVKARANAEERKRNTRRRILIGDMILALIKAGELDEAWLQKWADKMLSNPNDRKLFGLPEKKE